MTTHITIDIWSDIVCPWCYVGRERLVQAIERMGLGERVALHHHAYQLDPDRTVSEPLTDWLEKKFGPEHEAMTARVSKVGAQLGLTLDFSRGIAANTRTAHRIVHLATTFGKGDAMLERLMRAHFEQGLDIAQAGVLRQTASETGLPMDAVDALLASQRFDDEVQADIDVARELGIRGVPFFVFDRRFAVSGAQAIEVFQEALQRAMELIPANDPPAAATQP